MLIHSAAQLLTLNGGPQRGTKLGSLGIIEDGAVFIKNEIIEEVGSSKDLLKKYPKERKLDVAGKVLMPGFVDAHTHLIWAGDRAAEFEQRLKGKSYLDILDEGGGILSTVLATRNASLEELIAQSLPRLQEIFSHGSTTIEAKTGYGLELASELKLMDALLQLDEMGPWDLSFTFLAAHAIAPEYKGKAAEYANLVAFEMLPKLKSWWGERGKNRNLPFIDVFCETGAFDYEQSKMILIEAKKLDFPLKIHADEFDNLGGAQLAMDLGAKSVDHLVATSDEEIRAFGKSETVAVTLPATPFGLAEGDYTAAKKFIQADAYLAIASDLNPGTAWGESLQFSLALACRYLKLTPAQAIAASTINGAAALGLEKYIGSIEKGKQADLVILKENDYRHLGYRFGTNLVHTIIKKGKPYLIRENKYELD